ncbi:SDR family NAD(P)-dependent oxidoreductase [Rhodococcus erythropolis]|uniref:SDR family NAD(P)-dependent oxidoreductase n=1 Tax=Rhodococcus erythropolis TaxID=1833 RepID=UPI003808D43D
MVSGRFTGKTAIVAAASRGIGFGIAQRLVSDGATVGIAGRSSEALAAATAELGGPEYWLAVPGNPDHRQHQRDTVHLQGQAVQEGFGEIGTAVEPVVAGGLHALKESN